MLTEMETIYEEYQYEDGYESREEREEVEALEMCRKCYAFKYDNEWHFEKPESHTESDENQDTFVQFSLCSDCIEESLALYDDMEFA